MGNILIVIGIPLSILLLGIILIFASSKSKNNTKSETENNTSNATTSAPTPKSKGASKISNWFSAIAVIFLIIALVIFAVWAIGFVTKTYNSMKNAYHSPDKQYRMVLVVVDSITVYFDGNLKTAKENRIDPIKYDGFEFAGATEPFCIYNAEGDKFCGEKGSDPDMGNSTANRVLRFVSQNGEKGKITIKFLKKQKILVN